MSSKKSIKPKKIIAKKVKRTEEESDEEPETVFKVEKPKKVKKLVKIKYDTSGDDAIPEEVMPPKKKKVVSKASVTNVTKKLPESEWMKHVKKTREKLGGSYKDAMTEAKKSYKKK